MSGNLGTYLFSKIPYVAIDLGTVNTLIYFKNKGIVYNEPTILVKDIRTNKIVAIGKIAKQMEGKVNREYVSIRPLQGGTISDFSNTVDYLEEVFFKMKLSKEIKGGVLLLAAPSKASKLEIKALKGIAQNLGAKHIFIEEEVKMAAIGVGMNIENNTGKLVVDIGGGTTDIAIISSGKIVNSTSLKIAGNHFDYEIIKLFKNKLRLKIGQRTSEHIKKRYLNLMPYVNKGTTVSVLGGEIGSNLPRRGNLDLKDLREAVMPGIRRIAIEIHALLEDSPPQIVGDIKKKGIVLCGGGALIQGLDKYLESKFNLEVVVSDAPLTAVVDGAIMFDEIIANRLVNYEEWLKEEEFLFNS